LRQTHPSGRVYFRQGLWIEDLRTPPEQECSNGSLILFAVVLWRTFEPRMKLLKVRNRRFREVAEKCGQPEVYTLWQQPKTDRQFQSILKNNRVMTIKPSDAGTDFGEVGFHKGPTARYLVFPKSLQRFEGERIVGIDWALVKS
jgi:hypothetical protein